MISQISCRTKILIKNYISIFVAKKCRTSSTRLTFHPNSPLFKKLYFSRRSPKTGNAAPVLSGIVQGICPFFLQPARTNEIFKI